MTPLGNGGQCGTAFLAFMAVAAIENLQLADPIHASRIRIPLSPPVIKIAVWRVVAQLGLPIRKSCRRNQIVGGIRQRGGLVSNCSSKAQNPTAFVSRRAAEYRTTLMPIQATTAPARPSPLTKSPHSPTQRSSVTRPHQPPRCIPSPLPVPKPDSKGIHVAAASAANRSGSLQTALSELTWRSGVAPFPKTNAPRHFR
jgi:hypothetical protein